MADPGDPPSVSDAQLEAVNEALVVLHERHHGRRPRTARTSLMGDDMVVCLLGDIYTNVEQTMIEMQRKALVQQTRSEFQRAMEGRFIDAVERITERRVDKFMSTHHVGPDLELEIFVLAPPVQA